MIEIIIVIIIIMIIYFGGSMTTNTSALVNAAVSLGIDSNTANTIIPLIVDAANNADVDAKLAVALAIEESALNNNAVNPSGAIGIFQLMPATAAYLGVDPTDVNGNIQGGISYMASVSNQFQGNASQILAAFDMGPTGLQNLITEYGSNWQNYAPAETKGVISKVSSILNTISSYGG